MLSFYFDFIYFVSFFLPLGGKSDKKKKNKVGKWKLFELYFNFCY